MKLETWLENSLLPTATTSSSSSGGKATHSTAAAGKRFYDLRRGGGGVGAEGCRRGEGGAGAGWCEENSSHTLTLFVNHALDCKRHTSRVTPILKGMVVCNERYRNDEAAFSQTVLQFVTGLG